MSVHIAQTKFFTHLQISINYEEVFYDFFLLFGVLYNAYPLKLNKIIIKKLLKIAVILNKFS